MNECMFVCMYWHTYIHTFDFISFYHTYTGLIEILWTPLLVKIVSTEMKTFLDRLSTEIGRYRLLLYLLIHSSQWHTHTYISTFIRWSNGRMRWIEIKPWNRWDRSIASPWKRSYCKCELQLYVCTKKHIHLSDQVSICTIQSGQ